ncbi:MAG TPA: biotin/lipoyl-containing protein [Clostridia bacterium]|nr:biotin/lipoyl-containing protein [Clostridia bacterium]
MKYVISLNGKNYEVKVEKTDAVITNIEDISAPAPAQKVKPVATPEPVAAPEPVQAPVVAPAPSTEGEKVLSPMPGNIISVTASEGESIKAGDVIMILEAMKMENDIVAPNDGVIKQILVSKGSTVNTDDVLAVI